MNLTCYIIDDEPAALKVLREYIGRTPGLHLIGETTDPMTGLNVISGSGRVGITFLDVDMPEISGLALASLIANDTTVIFTTGYREYAAAAYDKNAVDYLLKPVTYDRFLQAVQKAKTWIAGKQERKLSPGEPAILFVKTGVKGQLRSIRINDILYAAAALNYLEIFLAGERVVTYLQLNELLEKLPETRFSRIHKSYLLNHACIQTMEYAQVRLTDKTVLPVGRTYRAAFREKMSRVLLVSKQYPEEDPKRH